MKFRRTSKLNWCFSHVVFLDEWTINYDLTVKSISSKNVMLCFKHVSFWDY